MAQPFKWPVPETPPDEGSFHTCQFSASWLPVVVSVLNDLRDPKVWDNPPDDITAQVDTLIDLVLTNLD